ncbi:MAG: T9SS type A sorting domain-containing protein [Bacteroidales bacterium]|nr:T9SS type A sorting domain-containing protein [Bacteroidales bacterium]
MLKTLLSVYFVLLIFSFCSGQNWIQPVNVSNLEYSAYPDITIDESGVIHIVWSEYLENNFRKIMYSYSDNDGETWNVPFDLSQNNDTSCLMAHIVAGNNNKLFVTYDYNTGNPYQTYVHMKIFDGSTWGPTIVVSENLPASHHNILVRDNDDRVYVFWYRGYKFCYRYLENDSWSDISFPYENHHSINNVVPDSDNNLHCVGHYTYHGVDVPGIRITYFKYIKSTEQWSDIIIVNDEDTNVGTDIALDVFEKPHFIWNQHITNSWPWINGTIYCHQTAPYTFSDEEIIDDYTYLENIHISENNIVNVFLSIGYEDSWAFKHYYKVGDNWFYAKIDSSFSDLITGGPNVTEKNGQLYVSYFKCFGQGDCDIMFSKSDLVTNIHQNQKLSNGQQLIIFPNPFSTQTTIKVNILNKGPVIIRIYNVFGKLINTLTNSFLQPGEYKFNWDGNDASGNKINKGIYIVRLEHNGSSESQIIHFINGN